MPPLLPGWGANSIEKRPKERRREAAMSRRAAKTVKQYLDELMDGTRSHLQLADAIANYAGKEAASVFEEATGIILDMLTHCMAPKLIKLKLKNRFNEPFESLVEAIMDLNGTQQGTQNGQIKLQKEWKKLPLPINLNTNSGKDDQKGSETSTKNGSLAAQSGASQLQPGMPSATPQLPPATPSAGQQVPSGAPPTLQQYVELGEIAQTLFETAAPTAAEALTGTLEEELMTAEQSHSLTVWEG